MSFEESLRLSIALGLTIFLVLLRFDSERIMRSDYFRYRYPWLGPVSYYGLVVAFAIGIMLILPNGPGRLFLTPGDPEVMLPLMLGFAAVGVLNAIAFAFRWYGGVTATADLVAVRRACSVRQPSRLRMSCSSARS